MGWPDWFCDVGRILAVCLQDLSSIRPADPFEYMAHWLYRYADSEQYRLEKMEYLKKLKEAYKELKHDQMARRRRLEDYKGKIETFKRELCDFQGPLTIMDFLKKREADLKRAMLEKQVEQDDRFHMAMDYDRPGAKANIFSVGVQPPSATVPTESVKEIAKEGFDPDLMVKKGTYGVEAFDAEAEDLFLGDREHHDDFDHKRKMLGDYFKKRMTGEIDPFSRESKRHIMLPFPDSRSGSAWEDFVHGAIGQPVRKPASMNLVDKVYVDSKGNLRRAVDGKKVSVDKSVKAPDGYVALNDGMVIPVANIRAKKPEDDPDFPKVVRESKLFGTDGDDMHGHRRHGRESSIDSQGRHRRRSTVDGRGRRGRDGRKDEEYEASKDRHGRRNGNGDEEDRPYDDEYGRHRALGRRRSSGKKRRESMALKEYYGDDYDDVKSLSPSIAQWYLEDDAKHLKCEHPVLGRLGIVLLVELPPEWFDRDFSCRTFYQPEIYTNCAADGVRLLDLQSSDYWPSDQQPPADRSFE